MKLTKILKEIDDNNKFGWHLRKPQIIRMLYKKIDPLTNGLKRDTGWQNVSKIWKVFNDLDLDWDTTKVHYGDREHDKTFPPEKKYWWFEINFKNQNGKPDKVKGYLVASGAGRTEDPLEKYDITVVMS